MLTEAHAPEVAFAMEGRLAPSSPAARSASTRASLEARKGTVDLPVRARPTWPIGAHFLGIYARRFRENPQIAGKRSKGPANARHICTQKAGKGRAPWTRQRGTA